jgi:predicted transcriptional regulator
MKDREKIISAWEELYATVPPRLAEGEKTVAIVSKELGCTVDTARRYLRAWEKEGKVEYLGKRRSGAGPDVDAWRLK